MATTAQLMGVGCPGPLAALLGDATPGAGTFTTLAVSSTSAFTGAAAFTSTVTASDNFVQTASGKGLVSSVDTLSTSLSGGTVAVNVTNGGYFRAYGASHATLPGVLRLSTANVANATIDAFIFASNSKFRWVDGSAVELASVDTSGNYNSVAGEYRTAGNKVGYTKSVYASGTAYTLTAVSAALDFGTTDPVVVLDKAGTYKLSGRVNLKYNGATFAASRTVTLKFRRTNNTAADLTNGSSVTLTAVVTTVTATFMVVELPEIFVTTANTDDSITIFGDVSVIPTAGSFDAAEASITAVRLY